MTPDKFKAVWVSHSSISDFIKCPRLYYLRNVYKDPRTGNKFTIVTPPLSLGGAVHEVVESLSVLPTDERFSVSLLQKFDVAWQKVSGKLGGFKDSATEKQYKERGQEMLRKLMENPGVLTDKAIKIKSESGLPYYWLNEEENIILCGKIDWIHYLTATDSVEIIDFKTGKNEENEDSLQLPIYYLLAKNLQKRPIEKVNYWYLDSGKIVQMQLPDEKDAYERVYEVAKRMKLGRLINHLKCPTDGCFACRPFEEILKGNGEKVGLSEYRQDLYIL